MTAIQEETLDETPWSRLNVRMLLVHPIRELIKYLPVLLIALIAGTVGGEPWWAYVLSGLGVLVGVSQWFATTYRITATHVEVRRGLLNRQRTSVPRDRIRSVDVDSTLLHRIFGLSVVKVGTGASHGKEGLEFNAVSASDVPALRRELLRQTTAQNVEEDAPAPTNLSGWRSGWARYAPFTLAGVASIFVVAMFFVQMQFFEGGALTRVPLVESALGQLGHLSFLSLVVWGGCTLIVVASAVAVVRYLLSYSKFTIGRTDASTLHVSHGLLRTRQVTLDEKRMRGVQVNEPLSLRLVGASSAHAIMTGLGRERGGVALIDPPGPSEDELRVASAVLGTSEPLEVELQSHGIRARRRRYTRAALGVGALAVAAAVLQLTGVIGAGAWLAFVAIIPFAAFLAWDRYRGLGHALVRGWLVTRSGSLNRKRAVLATDGIIGWTIRRSLFQRRAGLATLIATTAAGRHRYSIPDLPMGEVWPLIEAVSGVRRSYTDEWDQLMTAMQMSPAADDL
jgi:putative membrane protein